MSDQIPVRSTHTSSEWPECIVLVTVLGLLVLWLAEITLLHSGKDVGRGKLVGLLLRLLRRLRRGHIGYLVESRVLRLLESSSVACHI